MKRADVRAFRLTYAAWLFGIFAYFIPAATWNPVSHFNLTRAIVEHGSIRVDPYASSTGDRAFVNGHWYSDKAPVASVLAVPAYAVARIGHLIRGVEPGFEAYGTERIPAIRVIPNKAFQQGLYVSSLFTSGIAGIAVGLLLFELLRRRVATRRAFLGSAAAVLGTIILPYGASFYGHVPAAAFMLGAIVALDERGQRLPDGLPSPARLRIAGACLALAAGSEYLVFAPASVVGIWYLLKLEPRRRLPVLWNLGLGAAIPALALGSYHAAAFGAPWRTGYSFETQPEFAVGHSVGLMGIHLPTLDGLFGLTFSVRRGLFYVSPLLLAGLLFAVRRAVTRRDWALGAGLSVTLVLLFLNAGYYMWWGGAAAGPRHLIPGLAFLAAGIAFVRTRPPWVPYVLGALACISVVNALGITFVGVEAPERGDVLRDFVWGRMRIGRIAAMPGASNLGLRMGLPPVGSVLPVVAWTGFGFLYLMRLIHRGSARKRLVA